MANDYLPDREADLWAYAVQFSSFASANQVALNFSVAQTGELATRLAAALAAKDDAFDKLDLYESAVGVKNEAKAALVEYIRLLVQKYQNDPDATNAGREGLNITIPDTTPTPLSPSVIEQLLPPVLEVVCNAPQRATVTWHPAAGSESDALPAGIAGISIHVAEKATDGTVGPFQWLALDSNSPYVHNVGNAATVTKVYRAQWYDRLKRMGPFGDMVEVAVTA